MGAATCSARGGADRGTGIQKRLDEAVFDGPPYMEIAAGRISVLILTLRSRRIRAAASRSSYLAPVQEPMYALSRSTEGASLTTETF